MPALVPEGLAQGGSQRERAVLDGVVLVDAKIAAAGQVQGKAAVLRDLFQHVVEEPDARVDAAGPLRATGPPRRRCRFPWSCA